MICLSDSDLIIKLAEFDLLDETLRVLRVRSSDVRVPPELRHVLCGRRIYEKHSRAGIERAGKFASAVKTIEGFDKEEQILLESVTATFRKRIVRVDGGEALLYSATKSLTNYLVATGDKNSLRALASADVCAHIHARLKGRVLCLEQIVLKLIDAHGYKHVQQRVGPGCACDDCIQQAFANGKPTMQEKDCRRWLDDYVRELRSDTMNLLVP